MDEKMAFDLAVGMCENGGVKYQINNSGDEIRTLFGSAAVYLNVSGSDELLSYQLRATFVEDIDLNDATELAVLRWVNSKNCEKWYGRYCLVEDNEDGQRKGMLIVENEILAANVQQAEFLNALHALWNHADNADDEAAGLFGGKTAEQIISGQSASSDAEDV